MKTTQEKIAVMQAHIDGKVIESKSHRDIFWSRTITPVFNWSDYDYRVKPEEPDYIDWSHVHENYNYMARDSVGVTWLFGEKPSLFIEVDSQVIKVNSQGWHINGSWKRRVTGVFASYKQGTVDWIDSLVERPKS